ncbi:hypothetical protein ACEPAI_934 [Sanghuangporus weigelae]
MRRLNRVTTYIHVSIFLAFVAGIFDLSQIFRRGYRNMTYDLEISSVEVLIILREITHALSFGMRYLFFWAFVAEPPRGELPFVPMQDDRRPNFISLSSDSVLHSGDWARLKLIGIFLKWALLLLVVAVLTLQILWRLVNAFQDFGPVYVTDAGIEIGLSVAFILKLVINAFISPLAPRWHTLRDYSPVILALLFGMGVAIGNLLCFKFTESTLGRFFQAVELYILILFVLISAFYKMPVRTSVVAELVRRRLTAAGYGDLENAGVNNRQSQLSMVQAPYSMPQSMGVLRENENRRMDAPSRPSFTERISSSSIFSSRLMSRRGGSGQIRALGNTAANEEGDQRRLWDRNNPDPSPSPGAQRSFRNSLDNTPEQTPTAAMREAPGWSDPVLTSVMPDTRTGTLNPMSAGTKGEERDNLIPQIVVADDASQYTTDRNSTPMPSLPLYSRDATDSPVYGLDGIIRNLQQSGAVRLFEEDINSQRSSGIESLLRQQAELDKSIAGLRRFSMASGIRTTSRMQSDSLQSDISLSNFPEPPTLARSLKSDGSASLLSTGLRPIDEDAASVPETEIDRSKSMAISTISDNSMIVDDVTFQLLPPRMPAVVAEQPERAQNQSVPTISRDSLDSVLQDSSPGRAFRLDSQGTQYDVTSFIGGLTTPAIRDSPQLTDISERDRLSDTDSGNNDPGTIADAKRVQVVDKGRPSEDSVPDSGIGESSMSVPDFVPPPPAVTVIELQPSSQSQPQEIRPQLMTGGKPPGPGRGRGLPTGPRGRLEISNPIRRNSSILNDRTAFQRPRPAPLVLQNANDNQPTAPDAPRNARYF